MKTTTFNFKRFNLLIKKDLIFNSKLYALQLLAIFTVITLISYIKFYKFKSAPINIIIETILNEEYSFSWIIITVLFSVNFFKFYSSKIKTHNFIISPNSQIEKLCYEFLKIIIFLPLYPLLFTIAFKTGYLIKSIEWTGINNYPTIVELIYYCFSVKTPEALIEVMIYFIYSTFIINVIYMLGNLFFRKYRFIKTTIIFVIFCYIIFLIKIEVDKNGVQYNSTILNILTNNYSFIAYLVVLKTLIYLRFKKIQA